MAGSKFFAQLLHKANNLPPPDPPISRTGIVIFTYNKQSFSAEKRAFFRWKNR